MTRRQSWAWAAIVAAGCGATDGFAAGPEPVLESEGLTEGATMGATSLGPVGSGSGGSGTSIGTSDAVDSTGSAGSDDFGATEDSTGEPVDPQWKDFLDARADHLESLAVPIVACSANVDTGHPAFHGCIDWHSHVHATYALHVISRITGDPSYQAAAEETLDPAALMDELLDVQTGQIPQEIPYGYAWFLALAVERERATGALDLRPLAEEIVQQLTGWLESRTLAQLQAGVLSDDYGNISWAVLNLWRWARWVDDSSLETSMEAFTHDVLLSASFDQSCPLSAEQVDLDDFFPPCLHRAMAITAIADPELVATWVEANVPEVFELVPLGPETIGSAHQGGLNFSRAWGLWHLFVATGDPMWRDLYIAHIETHIAQPAYWAENYFAYSHWVAQFGVYAIALSEPEP